MALQVIPGTANESLAQAVAAALKVRLCSRVIERYAGGELHVELGDSVRSEQVFIVQPTGDPVERNLFEILLLADACYREGAASITAVIPYFGYGRQDRRAHRAASPLGARLVADMLAAAHVDRVVAVDLHAPATESFFAIPVDHLSAVPLLIEGVRSLVRRDTVLVAPDMGAARLAARFASELDLPMAVVHKLRLSGSAVEARGLTGEVAGRSPLIVDDMVTTGSTIEAATHEVLRAGANHEIVVATSHSVLEPDALARLDALPLQAYITTDTLAPGRLPANSTRVTIDGLLADAIQRLHTGRELTTLRADV